MTPDPLPELPVTKAIVTAAPPNPNGDLHLGHLSGPFLGADVLRRHLRQRGCDVTYVSYVDDLSCYVERRARELSTDTRATAHHFGRRIEGTLSLAGMLPDHFAHPLQEPAHAQTVQRLFMHLWRRGVFEKATLPAFWCRQCEHFLYEAEVRGVCQYCTAASDGFYCEECGRPQEAAGLAKPYCVRCGSTPDVQNLRRLVVPLERYREQLRAHYAQRPLRPRLRKYLDDMLARPLPVTTVTRYAPYGVPVPLAGWRGHILDTWYSGLCGYLSAAASQRAATTGAPPDAEGVWSEPDSTIVHFLGFDCSFSHAILWPALALAHGSLPLPSHVVTNEFYRLEGEKFSTSRGHALWGSEMLSRVPADPVRYYLCATGPEQESTSFYQDEFVRYVNETLRGPLQRWVDAVWQALADGFESRVPSATPAGPGALEEVCRDLLPAVSTALAPAEFSASQATARIRQAVSVMATDATGLRHGSQAASAGRLALHVEALARVAAAVAAIMPATAAALWQGVGLTMVDPLQPTIPWPSGTGRLVDPDTRVGPKPELFPPVPA